MRNDESKKQLKVIVTAGASGIGLAIAKKFLAEGSQVYICDAAQETLDKALSENPSLQGKLTDVGNPQQVEAFFVEALTSTCGIDVLINNAGIGGPRAKIQDIDYTDWDDCIRINLSGMFYCLKQVIPTMKKQGSGCIVNISTTSAKTGLPNRLAYVASKKGVLSLIHNLARELGPANIRCNTILPGMVDNARGGMLVGKSASEQGISVDKAEQEFLKHISQRTWVTPEEIAKVACFLTSDDAKHITAQKVAVDGNLAWEQ